MENFDLVIHPDYISACYLVDGEIRHWNEWKDNIPTQKIEIFKRHLFDLYEVKSRLPITPNPTHEDYEEWDRTPPVRVWACQAISEQEAHRLPGVSTFGIVDIKKY